MGRRRPPSTTRRLAVYSAAVSGQPCTILLRPVRRERIGLRFLLIKRTQPGRRSGLRFLCGRFRAQRADVRPSPGDLFAWIAAYPTRQDWEEGGIGQNRAYRVWRDSNLLKGLLDT